MLRSMVLSVESLGEPPRGLSDPHELLAAYLDYYRNALLRKLDGIPEEELRTSRLPSGWTPLELLKHLACVERRWLQWGMLAEPVERPWGENAGNDPDRGWHVAEDEPVAEIMAFFRETAERSREIVGRMALGDVARVGGRFATPEDAPTLAWILFHLLQEYARHTGQLDVVRELIDGGVGE
jgi:uncharacterized damage-inducible protein DinB